VIGYDEAADRADRFGKGADHEIDVGLDARFLEHAAAIGTEEAHAMSFVHNDHGAVPLGHRHHSFSGAMSPSIE
jgi:hypothetical protein